MARERSEEILADLTRQLSISREEMETRAKSQASWREKRKEERNENPGD